jgi:MFS family permease
MMNDNDGVVTGLSPTWEADNKGPVDTFDEDTTEKTWVVRDARPLLPKAAFFMGDLRDGLPMLNMQFAFLMIDRGFSKTQLGLLMLCFGLAQTLCLAPSGYFLDYSNHKIKWVMGAGFFISIFTVLTPLTAASDGGNMGLMMFFKILQGGVCAILPPGFNALTLGIVGATGFTHQVSRNRMAQHLGTATVVAIGTVISYFTYPSIGQLFIVSPLAAIAFWYNLSKIKPHHVNKDAARALIIASPTMTEYEYMDDTESLWSLDEDFQCEKADKVGDLLPFTPSYVPPDLLPPTDETHNTSSNRPRSTTPRRSGGERTRSGGRRSSSLTKPKVVVASQALESPGSSKEINGGRRSFGSLPSFNFWTRETSSDISSSHESTGLSSAKPPKASTPFSVLMDRTLLTFALVVFFFNLSNAAVLPLVMSSLQVKDAQAGLLLSGMSIMLGQTCMAYFAKLVGTYSPIYGRKNMCLLAISSLTLRCFLLTLLVTAQDQVKTWTGVVMFKFLILSTQVLDSVGMGIFGTLHIIVTNDISGGTGRFSLMMGITTGAMCLGGTGSGFMSTAIARDYGDAAAFAALGVMSLIPFLLYLFLVPETLPEYAKPQPNKRRKRLEAILHRINMQTRNLAEKNPFKRRDSNKKLQEVEKDSSADSSSPKMLELV